MIRSSHDTNTQPCSESIPWSQRARFQTFPGDPQLSFLSSDAFTVSTLVLMKANTSKTALSWKLCENVMDEWPRLLSITFSLHWVKTNELRADSCFYFDGVVFTVRVSPFPKKISHNHTLFFNWPAKFKRNISKRHELEVNKIRLNSLNNLKINKRN